MNIGTKRDWALRLLRGVGAGLVATGLTFVLAAALPQAPGVVLSAAERGAVFGELWLGVLGLGAVLGFIVRPAGWVGAAMLPPALLLTVARLPVEGRIHVRPDGLWWVAVGGVLLTIALASPLARGASMGVAAIAGAFGAIAMHGLPAVALAQGPDVWLITLDTVRADQLDFIGGDVPTAHTPVLSALAAESRVFRAAYSPVALTGPAHTTILSGVDPLEHGVRVNGEQIPASLPWLPALMRQAGWATRAWVSAAVLDASLGFSRGFDAFDGTFTDRLRRGHPLLAWRGYRRRAGSAYSRPGAQTIDALLADDTSGPRFTWVHLYDAHWPYAPSEAAARREGLDDAAPLGGANFALGGDARFTDQEVARGRRLYRAGIDDVDALVGRILAVVPDDAVLIVVADHGESLGEHDYTFNHGKLCFAPDTHVPLLVRAPGLTPGVIDTPVGLADVAPTVLALLGIELPPAMQGRSLIDPDPARVVISASYTSAFGQQITGGEDLGPWASVAARRGDETVAVSRWQARARYERRDDPRELRPLALDGGSLGAELDEALAREVTGEDAPRGDMVEGLRALGYVE